MEDSLNPQPPPAGASSSRRPSSADGTSSDGMPSQETAATDRVLRGGSARVLRHGHRAGGAASTTSNLNSGGGPPQQQRTQMNGGRGGGGNRSNSRRFQSQQPPSQQHQQQRQRSGRQSQQQQQQQQSQKMQRSRSQSQSGGPAASMASSSGGLASANTSAGAGGGGPRKKTNMSTYHRRASNERNGNTSLGISSASAGPGGGAPMNRRSSNDRSGGGGGRGRGKGGSEQRRRPSSGPPSRQPSSASGNNNTNTINNTRPAAATGGPRRVASSSGAAAEEMTVATAVATATAMTNLADLEEDLLSKEKEKERQSSAGVVGVGAYRVPPSSGLTAPPDAGASVTSYSQRPSRSVSASDPNFAPNRRPLGRLSSHHQEQAPRAAQNRRASDESTGQHSHTERSVGSGHGYSHHPPHDMYNPDDPEMATTHTGSSGGGHYSGGGVDDSNAVTAVAVPVSDNENYRSTKNRKGAGGDDGGWMSGKKLRLLIAGLLLLVVGLGAGVGIALSKSGGDDSSSLSSSSNGMGMEMDGGGEDGHGDHGGEDGHGDHGDDNGHSEAGDHMDHSMGEVDGTSRLVELASIDGSHREGEFGTSVSLSESGQRIAISSGGFWQSREAGELFPRRGIVQVYTNSDGDGKWNLLGDEIKTSAQDDRNDVADERNIPLPVQRNIYVVEMSRDGQRVAIGSAFHDVNFNSKNVGMVEIFALNERAGLWERVGQPILGSAPDDYSGAAISLSYDGSIIAIGSPGHNGTGGPDCGQLRVYRHSDSTGRWSRVGSNIDGEDAYDMIGGSVSLSADGSIVAVAGTSKHGSKDSVILRVYENKNGQWTQQGSGIKDPLANGLFDMGWSISLSAGGTVLVCSNYYIGAEGHIDSANVNDGHTHDGDADDEGLYVQSFHLMNGEWTAMGGNMHSHTMGPRSGYVVSISDDGRTIGMGDPGRAGNGKASGHAHVYRYHGSMWHHSHTDKWKIVEGDVLGMAAGDAFGHTVALSRNSRRLAVGAPYNRNQGFEHGRVRIFDIEDV